MDSGKDQRYSQYSTSCGQCIAKKWPNEHAGRVCFLGWKNPHKLQDYNRKEYIVRTPEALYELYELWEKQRIARSQEKLSLMSGGQAPEMERDNYADWLLKRGICPHALVTSNSKYHLENSVLLDAEMGLILPDPKCSLGDTPELFFQALRVVRYEKGLVRQEETDAPNNRN